MSTSISTYGNGYWWLRTASDDEKTEARVYKPDGTLYVYDADWWQCGVAPALKIKK